MPERYLSVAGEALPHSRLKTPGRSVPGPFLHWLIQWPCSRLQSYLMTPRMRARRRADDRVIETAIPSRLDALPWSGFHTRVVLALGITWILDGLEVTLGGRLSGALKESPTLHFSNFDVGLANSSLSRRRRARRDRLRLAHRPHRPPQAVLHHARALSLRDRGDRVVMERRRATRCFASSPAPASAANTPRSTPPSRSWCRRAIAAGPISSSTAASGSAPRSAPSAPSCCSIPPSPGPISAGGSPISPAPCSA